MVDRFPDLGHEAIPMLRYGFDELLAGRAFAERMSQMRNVVSEIAFLDDGVGPQDFHQLVFPDEPSVVLDEHEQRVEQLRSQGNWTPFEQEPSFGDLDPERTEFVGGSRRCHRQVPKEVRRISEFPKDFPVDVRLY